MLLVFSQATVRADALSDAEAFISSRQYDDAIAVLEKEVKLGKANAQMYDTLGRAYNWKQDFENALKNYRVAAKLDKRYMTAALPILSHFELYDEIIDVGESALANNDRKPTVLTALLNAYFIKKNTPEYQRILGILKAQRYSLPYDANYRLYILAKAEVRAGHREDAITYIKEMNDKSLLQFMRNQKDFSPIADDPRFLEMTK